MSLTYNTLTTSLANIFEISATDPGFVTVLPNVIDDAEQRMYRELDLLATVVTDASGALAAGSRNFTLPGGNAFFEIHKINAISPAGTTNPDAGIRVPLTPASKELMDGLFPSAGGATTPNYFARVTQSTIIVAPWPDGNYQIEVVGTQRPTPISATNQVTFLSQYLPDAFLSACCVFMTAFQQNWSAGSDNPQSSVSWETHYQSLMKSASLEEIRKKFGAPWPTTAPDPTATAGS